MSDDNAAPADDDTTAEEETPVAIAPSTVSGRMTPGQFAACGQVITRAGVCRDARLKGRRCATCEPIFANEATAASARRADPVDEATPAPAGRRPRSPRKPRP